MATNSRLKRRAKKRPTSTKEAEAGVKSAQMAFAKILAIADPQSLSKQRP